MEAYDPHQYSKLTTPPSQVRLYRFMLVWSHVEECYTPDASTVFGHVLSYRSSLLVSISAVGAVHSSEQKCL